MSFQHCSEKETSSSVRRRKTGPGKKILSGLIILALVFSILPATFFAFSKQAKAEDVHQHEVSTECYTDQGTQVTFTALSGVLTGLSTYVIDGYTYWVLPAGDYYLDQDITLTHNLIINSGSVSLCLNGYMLKGETITSSSAIAVITATSDAGQINICDCNGGNSTHKFEAPADNEGNPAAGYWKYTTSDIPSAADCVITTVSGGIITGGDNSRGISSEFYLNFWGGNIVGNNNGEGGGMYIEGSAFMNGGSIKGNCVHTTDSFGGGVSVGGPKSDFYMNGGIIEKNFGDVGSGIGAEYGKVYIYGGTVSGNEGTSAIYGRTVTIGYGSIIEDNYGEILGGVFGKYLIITGGRITGNTTVPDVDMGIIFGAVVASNSLNISGSPVIAGNMAQGAECNVYLGGAGCDTITVNGQLNSSARIGVTVDTAPTEGSPMDIALSFDDGAGETYDITAMDAGKFFSDSKSLYTEYDSTNKKVVLKVAPTHTHSVSTDCSTTAGDQVDFVPLTSCGGTLGSGNYFLMGDVELGDELEIADGTTVNLCLNGNILKGPSDSEAIWVREGGTLNLCDCGTSEKHYFDTASIPWTLDTTATEESGTVKAVNGGVIGCGAYHSVVNSGAVTMYGGHFIGNEALGNGGGINNYGSFTMKGGKICNNYAESNLEADSGAVLIWTSSNP
ncbi:MAG: hypothetical protein HUJ75_00610, partial [Parasporobacterium sp.]|nr:hypothetical protein [Parasporobacterium sp.]